MWIGGVQVSDQAQRWSVIKGDTFKRSLALLQSNGQPYNLTGASITGQVRNASTDALIATFVVAIDSPATLGTALLSLADDTTAALGVDLYVFDIKLGTAAGETKTLLAGEFRVTRRVTQ